MKLYEEQAGQLIARESLWESLLLSHISPAIISIVGAGGKTSVMYQLAEELAAQGRRVIVTTSTHIVYPSAYQTVILQDPSELADFIWSGRILVVGGQIEEIPAMAGTVALRKLKGLNSADIHRLAKFCEILLIEADGAKQLPLKLPAAHEPVIIPETDTVIGCAGLDAVGKTWEQMCFRRELAEGLLGITKTRKIQPEDVARILTDSLGTAKAVGERAYRIVLNKADDEVRLDLAGKVIEALHKIAQIPCVVTSFAKDK
ncbi:MAG: selenium cofactor biosynthesis protein YqeC [Hungatella sp.]